MPPSPGLRAALRTQRYTPSSSLPGLFGATLSTSLIQARTEAVVGNPESEGLDTQEILGIAQDRIRDHVGDVFDLLTVARPSTTEAAVNLVKTISKLSPFVANLIEQRVVELLNAQSSLTALGKWVRQDPDFPDAVFVGSIEPWPGIEIKAWFPLATEITARFRDSRARFEKDQVQVAILAWLPESIFYGKPYLVDVCFISAKSVAEARDLHYHRPPDYLVIEPEDTTSRTRNLQQTNTNGYKFQGSQAELKKAARLVTSWGSDGTVYSTGEKYQSKLRDLQSRFRYRLDTNFAKIDRVDHAEIEEFKARVLDRTVHNLRLREWAKLMRSKDHCAVEHALREHLKFASSETG